jgi:chitin disaccharide deacetylase
MKRLIVNADDLGVDKARNAGIFEAIAAGSVTSCSLLSNGPALEDAIDNIRDCKLNNISFGVHLNLSEGRPLSSGLRQLTDQDGKFLGKASAQRLLTRCANPELEEEIRREFTVQILRLRNADILIDHLDGHQHIHVLPAVVRITAEVVIENEIPWVRIPEEPPCRGSSGLISSSLEDEARFFCRHAQSARLLFSASGIYGTDHFRGLSLKGHLPALEWMEFLESIPHGLTELMVHPGHAADPADSTPFSGFSTLERERELDALIDGRFRAALQKAGVELAPFPIPMPRIS